MTYAETLQYLYAQLPMYHRVGAAAYKKDLTNTLALCAEAGMPHQQFRSIHVGGTNGKGSVSHMLAAVLQAAGYKVGLYISPHYKDFRERIKVNGRCISRRAVVEFVTRYRTAIETIQPSFFELCVVMAFEHFAREKVDVAVVEVGLGGRLDSTNVISPLLSVITNISYDHMHMLGHTLPLIAGEKAGIIKPHVPVVIGEMHPESAPVFLAKAEAMQAPICFADQILDVQELTSGEMSIPNMGIFSVKKQTTGEVCYPSLLVEAGGSFQQKNVATVLQAVHTLQAQGLFQVPEKAVTDGLANLRSLTYFIGRWHVIGEQPTVLCDSAHNEAGLRSAFSAIGQYAYQRLHIVTGFVNDKDLNDALSYFPQAAVYYFAKANIPRGLDAAVLREKAATFGLNGKAYTSVRHALRAARRVATPNDLIVVIGSIFVVAEVL